MTASVLDALAEACRARPGEPGDAVAGVVPSHVAFPASVAEAAAVMRIAAERNLAVVPRGAATKLRWGLPPERCDLVVDTRGLGRVIEHVAGDLVVRVEAGVTLDDLRETLASASQQLSLDSPLPGATVGGALATATGGPRRFMYGSARDLLIGVTVVRADGVVAHSGGKVVKNVAGYDLGKLLTGSYGTLGLIVEAAFRLHPLPAASAYVSATAPDAERALEMVQAVLHSPLAPAAIEVDGPDPITVTVLVEGVPEGVAPRAEAMGRLLGGTVGEAPPGWWGVLPSCGALAQATPGRTAPADAARAATAPGGAVSAGTERAGTAPVTARAEAAGVDAAAVAEAAGLAAVADGGGADAAGVARASGGNGAGGPEVLAEVRAKLAALTDLLAVVGDIPGARIRGSAGRGLWHVALPPGAAGDALARLRRHGTAAVLSAPAGLDLDRWGPLPALPLMRRVKDQFDPGHRLSPGRFAGGI